MKFIATCKIGLESVVASELRRLSIEVESVLDARVVFTGDLYAMARACVWLRTAERVLFEIATFEATTFDALFEGVKAVDFKPYIRRDAFIHVNGKSAKSTLFSVSDCQSITKKAIVESMRRSYNTDVLPETGDEVIVEVGILRDVVSLTLDPCGAGLSRRGYRTFNVPAPLSETLGAGLLLLSRYTYDRPFVDPMCGSGTMPIEAAMIAKNQAPSINRTFAAETWSFLEGDEFKLAREEALDSIRDVKFEIEGSDIDAHCIDLCKKHAKKAGIMAAWAVRPLRELSRADEGGLIVTNPPYGERMMTKHEVAELYRDMRTVFAKLPTWQKSVITAYSDFEKVYGQRADKRRRLSNGGMPCTYYQFFAKAARAPRED